MSKGYLALVLHSHLPFVRHPEHDFFLEEHWLFEALTETYIPLINVFDNLIKDDIHFRITMSLSPTLISMLTDSLLQYKYLKFLEKLIDLAGREVERTRWLPEFHELALMYHHKLNNTRDIFANRYNNNIVTAFKKFQDMGKVDIITCGATHGFFPLMNKNSTAINAQVKTACNHYNNHLGRQPKGIWLPECGFDHGVDNILKESNLRYFFTDSHGILHGSPRPKFGVFAPVYCQTGVAAFGRDIESSKQVWSAQEGYPGDYYYRDFYRDIGFDLDFDYIKDYIQPNGLRCFTGLKYYRITGNTDNKEPYIPHIALEKAAAHAGNFMFNREKQVEYLYEYIGKKPIIVAPYDAELFGHWWYEGPDWINFLIRKIACDQDTVELITPLDYLERHPKNQVSTPSMSSWGYKGYNEVWLEGSNDWIYRHLHKMVEKMSDLANRFSGDVNRVYKRALNQAAREVLLAQSSDWAFIMKTGTMVEYALNRSKEHIVQFNRLYEDINHNKIDETWLNDLENKYNIFPDIDYRVYQTGV